MKLLLSLIAVIFTVQGFSQSDVTSKDIINKKLLYSFTNEEILMIFNSDSTLFWRDASVPKEANEKSKTIHINEHTIMTSWYESDKTFVTLLSDFKEMKVSGMVCHNNGRFYSIEGVIKLAE